MTDQFILTKGDNNPMDDLVFYKRGQTHLERNHIVGRVNGSVATSRDGVSPTAY